MEKVSTAAFLFSVVAIAALTIVVVDSEATMVEQTFVVHEMNVTHLCNTTRIFVVNGQFPGPTVDVTEGDTVVVHVINRLPHGLTIHWHGVRQMRSCWADGAGFITECPIAPGSNHTYRFNVTDQVGTLWWHAHVTCLRSTINGAFIIRPRDGKYPFPTPTKDVPIIIGEWWELDLIELDRRMVDGNFDDNPLSATINGKLGDLSNCSGTVEESFILDNVNSGEIYLLRLINTALFSEYYFKVAGHTFTVVAADANYLTPYNTDIVSISPGETIDVLMAADAPPGHYHMVALANQPPPPDLQIPQLTSLGLLRYTAAVDTNTVPTMPIMPSQHNTMPSYYFHANLTGLARRHRVPRHVDERLLITLGLGSICRNTTGRCKRGRSPETVVVATMNNVSFAHPNATSLLERYYGGNLEGVYTEDFPVRPPRVFNFTDRSLIPPGPEEAALEPTAKATRLRRFRYNSSVEIVFQSTTLLQSDSNPMHLHGYDVFVLAQGLGNFNPRRDVSKFNYYNPQLRNTVQVPRGGWAAVRFLADNPGMWYLHCHFEFHIIMGMATAFIVEDGPTPETSLPPPPPEFKRCGANGLKQP
uniref:Laccase n=1 Tax=Leersia perrieri TaxID=77586 RepID=A0A0D9XR10_9ORYZ